MSKFIALATTCLLFSSAAAFAQSPADPAMESSPAAQTNLQTSQTVTTETQDGNKVEIAPDGTVSVYKDEAKQTPPDGTLTLKDGSTINVKDGKKVM
jgi:hypothetical protein